MKELNFLVTTVEANTILDALSQLPYKDVNKLIIKILKQGEAQAAPVQDINESYPDIQSS